MKKIFEKIKSVLRWIWLFWLIVNTLMTVVWSAIGVMNGNSERIFDFLYALSIVIILKREVKR